MRMRKCALPLRAPHEENREVKAPQNVAYPFMCERRTRYGHLAGQVGRLLIHVGKALPCNYTVRKCDVRPRRRGYAREGAR